MLFHPTEFAMSRPTLLALVALIGGAAGIAIKFPPAALSSGTHLAHRKKTQPPCVARRVAMCVSLLHAGRHYGSQPKCPSRCQSQENSMMAEMKTPQSKSATESVVHHHMKSQCLLRRKEHHTTAWVESHATKLGLLVEMPELGGLWEIVEIYPYRLSDEQLKTRRISTAILPRNDPRRTTSLVIEKSFRH
jgi:hypothetical protein